MSAYDQTPGDRVFRLKTEARTFQCHRRNTYIVPFEKQSIGDHLFIIKGATKTGVAGTPIWRREIEETNNPTMWNRIIKRLGDIGCQTIEEDFMPPADVQMYLRYFGELPVFNTVELQTFELTQRLEDTVRRFGSGIIAITEQSPQIFWGEMSEPNTYTPYLPMWIG